MISLYGIEGYRYVNPGCSEELITLAQDMAESLVQDGLWEILPPTPGIQYLVRACKVGRKPEECKFAPSCEGCSENNQ
jgi:hypothetical protein